MQDHMVKQSALFRRAKYGVVATAVCCTFTVIIVHQLGSTTQTARLQSGRRDEGQVLRMHIVGGLAQ